MVDYSKWKRDDFSVTDVKLDPNNPRVPKGTRASADQRYLLSLYVSKYAVYELAKSIATNGYFPDEVLIIWPADKDNKFVLEGNRRIAALKLLLNPALAPENERGRFRKLAALVDDKKLLRGVPAVVAPSREAAAPIMQEKHTHTSVRPWRPLMQADFLAGLVATMGKEAVAQKSGITLSEIDKFLKMDKMYSLALTLDVPPDVAEFVLDKEGFPITTLQRLYNSPDIRKAIGISDNFQDITDEVMFEKAYGGIISDMAGGVIDSRKAGNEDQRRAYAEQLRGRTPPTKKPRSITVEKMLDRVKEPSTKVADTAAKKAQRSRRKVHGIVPLLPYKLKEGASVRILWDELRKISVDEYPNVSAAAFRVLLEKSIKAFLKARKVQGVPVAAREAREEGEVDISAAELGDLLGLISAEKFPFIKDSGVKRGLRDFRGAHGHPSLSTLNTYIHNEEVTIGADQARLLWPSLERLFIIMLTEGEQN